jgi:hypothetical protein
VASLPADRPLTCDDVDWGALLGEAEEAELASNSHMKGLNFYQAVL